MYQQRNGKKGGTLVDFDQSKRMSIQRRFSNKIVDMAEQNYDRWYIMGHSLGSVISLKGIISPGNSFASHMSFDRWFHGSMKFRRVENHVGISYPEQPRRQIWLTDNDTFDTALLFADFRGFITWGSPFETFAGTWPAMVHVLKNPSFNKNYEWLNFYDHVDVIASKLTSFDNLPEGCKPQNFCCSSSPFIFSSHNKYFSVPHNVSQKSAERLPVTALLVWMLEGNQRFSQVADKLNFKQTSGIASVLRKLVALSQWALTLVVGLLFWPVKVAFFVKAVAFFPRQIITFIDASRPDEYTILNIFDSLVGEIERLLSSLQPNADIFHDIWNFCKIMLIVYVTIAVGGFAHNMIDFFKLKTSESKHNNANDDMTFEE